MNKLTSTFNDTPETIGMKPSEFAATVCKAADGLSRQPAPKPDVGMDFNL